MDLYLGCLALGGAGLALLAMGGLARTRGRSGPGARHAGRGGRAANHGHAARSPGARVPATARLGDALWALTSPQVVLGGLVGFGASGLLARPLGPPWTPLVACVGAVAFERLVLAPMWRFWLRFASAPATLLDGAVLSHARATSSFDAQGQGLVALELDGQVVQLLATLARADRARGVRVRSGDRLLVEEVDPERQRCVVSHVGR